ncbi:MAG: hypothetical protein FWD78_12740 [Treponema sp.]|nr:hypothetical protein [Treponema sp.]
MQTDQRDVRYIYGSNGELLKAEDVIQNQSVEYIYNVNIQETMREYGNQTNVVTGYDSVGRIV